MRQYVSGDLITEDGGAGMAFSTILFYGPPP